MLGAGLLFIALGLPGALFPYPVARFSERTDAIGSRTSWTRVEPADWKVTLTRLVGLLSVAFGLALIPG
jgi:hypothetical protein